MFDQGRNSIELADNYISETEPQQDLLMPPTLEEQERNDDLVLHLQNTDGTVMGPRKMILNIQQL